MTSPIVHDFAPIEQWRVNWFFYFDVERGDEDECWPYRRSRTRAGYGRASRLTSAGKWVQIYAHRLAYIFARGEEIPRGMVICHRCDNPPCCNPAHLFLGTQRDNVHDAMNKGRRPRRADRSSGPRRRVAGGAAPQLPGGGA